MVEIPIMHQDGNWYMDSGVNNHLTSNGNNLVHVIPYSGPEGVLLGNGKSTFISHIGYGNLTSANLLFKLNKLLHVPQLTKNLIFIRQMCIDNHVLMGFFA